MLSLGIKPCLPFWYNLTTCPLISEFLVQPRDLPLEITCILFHAPDFLLLSFVCEQVMRKDSAIAEMNPDPSLSSSFIPPPFSRGHPREHMPPHKIYLARRPIGPPMPYMGTSNLKWKRNALVGATTGTPSGVSTSTDVEMITTGPVRSSRSLSYVRVAPYAIHGTADDSQKK